MLARTLAGRLLRPRLAPSLAALRGYNSPRASLPEVSAATDIAIDEDAPRPASPVGVGAGAGAAAIAATLPTVLQPRVLVYDGVCHLCHRGERHPDLALGPWGMRWVFKADKHAKIRFCCVQSKAAEPYLRLVGMDREDVLRRVLFIEGPEAYYEGSTAALKVASYLPIPYSVLSSLLIIPSPLHDAAYDYIAKNRYDWFGKDDECLVTKDQELLERFIDMEEMLSGGPSSNSSY